MKIYKEKDMFRGWFIGDFSPTALKTEICEAAIKRYKAGDCEEYHIHKVAVEVTLISEGSAEMNGEVYTKGDIIVIEPGEGTDFKAISDVSTMVIKIPSVKGDKFIP